MNPSLSTGIFPDKFTSHNLCCHSKKFEDLPHLKPVSHLSFLSKLTEKVVKSHLTDFLFSDNLLNTFQSTYTEFQSTTIYLLAVRDLYIEAMS
jgi:hypothetical protein